VARAAAVAVAAAVLMAGCGGDRAGGSEASITVLAASSLTEAFGALAPRFTAATGTDVELGFGASSAIADQVLEGIEADVVATASEDVMAVLVDGGAVGEPVVFARNRLEIAVPPGNPAGVASLADLADPSLTLALCAPQVPCGALAAEAFAGQGLAVEADTEEEDVKAVVDKVASGEVDAGVVYRTDVVAAAGDVDGVAVPDDENVVAAYPVAVVDGAGPAAAAFVDFVLDEPSRATLADLGFTAP
jgi:molybdate transport system substrate-binding protein